MIVIWGSMMVAVVIVTRILLKYTVSIHVRLGKAVITLALLVFMVCLYFFAQLLIEKVTDILSLFYHNGA